MCVCSGTAMLWGISLCLSLLRFVAAESAREEGLLVGVVVETQRENNGAFKVSAPPLITLRERATARRGRSIAFQLDPRGNVRRHKEEPEHDNTDV